jgi:CRP-like cAMP-binding protein
MAIDRKLLTKNEFFASIDAAALDAFASAGELKTFPDGDVVGTEMSQNDEIYLVVEGQLIHTFALADAGSGLDDFIIGPGEIGNAVRLFSSLPSYMTCVAGGDVKVVAWQGDDMKAICDQRPDVGYRLVCRAAGIFYERALRVNQMLLDNMSWGLG